jgi:putative iron-regulated protein
MTKTLKTWSAIGIAVLAGTQAAAAHSVKVPATTLTSQMILVDGEGGEGGESATASDESGGTTYALQSKDPNAFKYDGSAVVKAYAEHVFKSYVEAKSEAEKLQTAIGAFLSNPSDATLGEARKIWTKARPAYLRTEAFRFYDGPIEAIEGEINAWPLNEAAIDYVEGNASAGLVNDATVKIDKESIEGLNQKKDESDVTLGWHSIEFLLWGQDMSTSTSGQRPYTDYIAGSGNSDRRRAYLKLTSELLVHELDELVDGWKPGEDNYAKTFLALDQRESIGRMVNGLAILAGHELMLANLSGSLNSNNQNKEQSNFSDTTKQDFRFDLDGIAKVWAETGLSKLAETHDAKSASDVTAALSQTAGIIEALGDPWDQVLASPKGSDARNKAQELVVALETLSDKLKVVGNKLGVLVLMPSE